MHVKYIQPLKTQSLVFTMQM